MTALLPVRQEVIGAFSAGLTQYRCVLTEPAGTAAGEDSTSKKAAAAAGIVRLI
jgi:hypothetical protein